MEIGIDIEQNERFKSPSEKFLKKVFTENELAYAKKFEDSAPKLCAIWCVKEATVKAFSNAKLSYGDIEVCHDENGRPFVMLSPKIETELEKRNLSKIKISMSHSKDYSTAICILI